jgi:hypothetical protein
MKSDMMHTQSWARSMGIARDLRVAGCCATELFNAPASGRWPPAFYSNFDWPRRANHAPLPVWWTNYGAPSPLGGRSTDRSIGPAPPQKRMLGPSGVWEDTLISHRHRRVRRHSLVWYGARQVTRNRRDTCRRFRDYPTHVRSVRHTPFSSHRKR